MIITMPKYEKAWTLGMTIDRQFIFTEIVLFFPVIFILLSCFFRKQ